LSTCSQCGYLNPTNTKLCQQCDSALASPITIEQVSIPVAAESPAKRGITGTQREAIAVGVVLLIVIIVGVFALMSNTPSRHAPAPPVSTQQSWHIVATYSGAATIGYNSTAFTIRGSSFRLNWSYTTSYPDLQTFAVYDYPPLSTYPDGTPLPIICQTSDSVTASHGCNYAVDYANSGTSTLNQGPGSFYLQIIGSVDSWSIEVQDYY
jgi:hypothetical protein